MPMSMSITCSAGPEDAADDKGHDSSNGLSAFAEPSPNDSRASQAGPAWATRHCCRRHQPRQAGPLIIKTCRSMRP